MSEQQCLARHGNRDSGPGTGPDGARGDMVVGWYHSHPNLGAFLEHTIARTQRAFSDPPYSVGLVIDPMRGEEAWFIGPRSTPLNIESVLGIGLTTMSSGRRNESTEKGKQ